jgi:Flp pilus assembly pilin Flp
MPTRPQQHPLACADATGVTVRPIPARPARPGPDASTCDAPARDGDPATTARSGAELADQEGSVATEYGLLAVVAATIVSVMLDWATSGGISSLLASVMARVSSLVGL